MNKENADEVQAGPPSWFRILEELLNMADTHVNGKNALHKLREFYRVHTNKNLTQQMLIDAAVRTIRQQVEIFVKRVFIS